MLDVAGTGCIPVPDHLLGFVTDGVADLLELLLRSEQVMIPQELPTLPVSP